MIKDYLCNIVYIIIILVIGMLLLLAVNVKKRYITINKLIHNEGFENMDTDVIKDKLNITEQDIEYVKEKNETKKTEKTKKTKKTNMIIKPNKIINIDSDDIYDEFYSDVYDMVTLDLPKVLFEVKYIKSFINNDNSVKILDVGCGTGQHTKYLSEKNEYVGLDRSNAMLKYAKMNTNNRCRLVAGDANKLSVVGEQEFTNIICMYFTIYYFKNPNKIFYNFRRWLKPNGILIIHLVDKELFDPVLNPANPSRINSIQKYSKKRITSSIINFSHVTYISDFVMKENNIAEFQEIIRFKKTNEERRQTHRLYMYTNKAYVQIAKKNGFKLKEIKSMNDVKYEHNYLFVFQKID